MPVPFHKMFLFGLDNAGKTSIVNWIKEGQVLETTPTIAFNITQIKLKDFTIQIWDAPGQTNLRKIWNNGFNRAKVLVYVIDIADDNRFEESYKTLMSVLNDEDTKNIPLILCYHKIDKIKDELNIEKARKIFHVEEIKDRSLFEIKTSIYKPETINQLGNLIIEHLKKNKPYTKRD